MLIPRLFGLDRNNWPAVASHSLTGNSAALQQHPANPNEQQANVQRKQNHTGFEPATGGKQKGDAENVDDNTRGCTQLAPKWRSVET